MNGKAPTQVVVVTGASAGAGRAVAHAFTKRGAHIGLLTRGERGLDAHRRHREFDVGGSALKSIFGNKLSPRFADWHLTRTGYTSHQIEDIPVNGRPDNRFKPVPDQTATHGMFDSQAHERSYELSANTHRPLLSGAFAAAAAGAGLVRALR